MQILEVNSIKRSQKLKDELQIMLNNDIIQDQILEHLKMNENAQNSYINTSFLGTSYKNN